MKAEMKMQPQTRNPRPLKIELNSPETCGAERRRPQEVKPLVSNENPSPNPSQNQVLSLQSVRNLAKNSSGSRDVKGRQALSSGGENGKNEARGGRFKFSAPTNRLTAWLTVNDHGQRSNFPNFLAFSCLVILPCPFQLKSPIFYVQCQGNFEFW